MSDIYTLGIKADTQDIDRGKARLDDFSGSADRATRSTMALREGVNIVGKAVATFGSAGVAALTGITVSAASSAREIENLARVSGMTVEQFQQAAFAARTYGVEQDKLAQIFLDFQDRVGDFMQTGGGPLVDFFENVAPQIGVTAAQFRELSGKEGLQLFVDSLEKANLSQSDMVFYLEAVASDATLLQPLLENGGEGFRQMGERAEELNLILSEFDIENLTAFEQSLRESKGIASATADVIGATLAPFVKDLTDRFNDNAAAGERVREVTLDIAGAGITVAGVFADASRVFEIAGTAAAAFAFAVVESFDTAELRYRQAYVTFREVGTELDISLMEGLNSLSQTITSTIEATVNGAITLINELVEVLADSPLGDLAEKLGVEVKKINEIKIDLPAIDTSGLEQTLNEFKLQNAQLEAELETSNQAIEGAWQSVHDLMMQPLPSAQMDAWFESIKKAISATQELRKEQAKTNSEGLKGGKATAQGLANFEDDRVSRQLSGMKEITRFAVGAVDEQSEAREKLHKLETAFSIIEIGLSLKKAGANALEAISSAFAAPFPVNFASGAAMIAIMAGLGLFSGGGGGSGPTLDMNDGTGTALGSSEASGSITASQERFEDIQVDQLAELRGIRDGISSLTGGISLLARDLAVAGGVGQFSGSLQGRDFTDTAFGGFFAQSNSLFDITGTVGSVVAALSKTTKKIVDSGVSFIAQSLGDIIENGIIEASAFFTVETTKKKLFGLLKSSSEAVSFQELDTGFARQIATIFTSIGDTVITAAESLGFTSVEITRRMGPLLDASNEDFTGEMMRYIGGIGLATTETATLGLREALQQFQVNIGAVSLEGLEGDEVEGKLQDIFSQQADLIAEFLVPAIKDYQQVGEGAFETLTRVAHEQAIFNDAIAQLGIDLSELSNIIQIDIAQSVIELSGGIEKFREVTGVFFSEFFTEQEQFEQLGGALAEALGSIGLSMIDSRDAFRAALESIDLTTEAGQELFAQLLQLAPAFDQYFDLLEQREQEAIDTANRLIEEERRASQERINELTNSARTALSEIGRIVREQQQELRAQLANDLADIRAVFDAHRETVRSSTEAAIAEIEDQIAAVKSRAQLESVAESAFDVLAGSIRRQQSELENQFRGSLSDIGTEFDRRREAVQSQLNSQISTLNAQANAVRNNVAGLRSLASLLDQAVASVQGLSRAQASSQIENAIALGRRGGDISSLDLTAAVGRLSSLDEASFGSALELQKERAVTASKLGELGDIASSRLSAAERREVLMRNSIESARANSSAEIENLNRLQEEAEAEARARLDVQLEALEAQLAESRLQLDALLGIDTSNLTIAEAQERFAEALAELATADDNEAQISMFEQQIEALKEASAAEIENLNEQQAAAEEAAQQRFESQFELLQQVYDNAEAQLNALLGVPEGFESLADAQAALEQTLTAIEQERAESAERVAELEAERDELLQNSIDAMNENLAQILQEILDKIAPTAVTDAVMGGSGGSGRTGSSTTPRGSDADMQQTLMAISQASAKTAKVLQRWDVDGQPTNRSEN